MLKKKFICLGLSMIMLFTSIINTPAAVTAGQYYKIKYTHNKKTVTKRAIDARYNNKVIKTNIPGYIEGSISMYSAYWIFGRCSSISTKYSYSSKTKKITLTRGSQKLVLTLNSTAATINGKKITLPSAPRKVYYPARKKNYIMVPGDAVAKNLQLNYAWNNRLLAGLLLKRDQLAHNLQQQRLILAQHLQPLVQKLRLQLQHQIILSESRSLLDCQLLLLVVPMIIQIND